MVSVYVGQLNVNQQQHLPKRAKHDVLCTQTRQAL